MIIEWQGNVAAFAGNHQYWWPGQPWMQQSRISVTSVAPSGGDLFNVIRNNPMMVTLGRMMNQ